MELTIHVQCYTFILVHTYDKKVWHCFVSRSELSPAASCPNTTLVYLTLSWSLQSTHRGLLSTSTDLSLGKASQSTPFFPPNFFLSSSSFPNCSAPVLYSPVWSVSPAPRSKVSLKFQVLSLCTSVHYCQKCCILPEANPYLNIWSWKSF